MSEYTYHQVVHTLELRQSYNLEWCLDETAAEEVNGLSAVSAVADVGCLDGDHLDDRLEDWGLDDCAWWETDEDDCAAWANVLSKC